MSSVDSANKIVSRYYEVIAMGNGVEAKLSLKALNYLTHKCLVVGHVILQEFLYHMLGSRKWIEKVHYHCKGCRNRFRHGSSYGMELTYIEVSACWDMFFRK
jgi:hypothetical protein